MTRSSQSTGPPSTGDAAVLDREGLGALVRVLRERGRTVVGPTVRDGAVQLAPLESADELPWGWGVEAEAGRYRLHRRERRGGVRAQCGTSVLEDVPPPPAGPAVDRRPGRGR